MKIKNVNLAFSLIPRMLSPVINQTTKNLRMNLKSGDRERKAAPFSTALTVEIEAVKI
jgi:hypothetical protein